MRGKNFNREWREWTRREPRMDTEWHGWFNREWREWTRRETAKGANGREGKHGGTRKGWRSLGNDG